MVVCHHVLFHTTVGKLLVRHTPPRAVIGEIYIKVALINNMSSEEEKLPGISDLGGL